LSLVINPACNTLLLLQVLPLLLLQVPGTVEPLQPILPIAT
jgi:hypothetical protein